MLGVDAKVKLVSEKGGQYILLFMEILLAEVNKYYIHYINILGNNNVHWQVPNVMTANIFLSSYNNNNYSGCTILLCH
jgi:hypothetical protein